MIEIEMRSAGTGSAKEKILTIRTIGVTQRPTGYGRRFRNPL